MTNLRGRHLRVVNERHRRGRGRFHDRFGFRDGFGFDDRVGHPDVGLAHLRDQHCLGSIDGAGGRQRHGRDGRLGHGNRCLLCRRCFFGGRNRLRNMRVADRLTLRTPAWERRLSVGHRLSLRGLARTTTKRGIRGGLRASSLLRCRCCGLRRRRDGRGRLRGCWSDGRGRRGDRSLRGNRGRNRGRGALRSVSHWGLEGAAGYASGRHRLTGDRLGRALGEDHRPVVLA